MDTYADMLMEDLIECDVEETDGSNTSAAWTEQALDLFISQLKNVKKHTFSSDREMLQVVTNKMSHRSFPFSYNQIENKYNSLKKMYTEKREKNQSVEPELVKLFGDVKAASSKRQNSEEMLQSAKKTKVITIEDNSPNTSVQAASAEEIEKNKLMWTTDMTKIFLHLLEEYRPQLGKKLHTKKQMWQEICKRMREMDFEITNRQAQTKWKNLLRHYRDLMEMMGNSESSTARLPSKTAFPELFEIQPISVRSVGKYFEKKIDYSNDPIDNDDDDDVDDYDDTQEQDIEPLQFEEVCPMPGVEDSSSSFSLDRLSPLSNEQKTKKPSVKPCKATKQKTTTRKAMSDYEMQMLQIEKKKLQQSKEQTAELRRIGDALTLLIDTFKAENGRI